MRSPEGIEKDKIKKYLDKRGVWYFLPYMAGRGKAGVPDIIGCLPISGRFFAVEVKRSGKMPTARQYQRLDEIDAKGGFVCWGDAEKVILALQRAV